VAGACRGLIELCASGSLGRLKSPMISAARSRWEVLGSGRCWAILLLHANEVVSSDRLIDELWGDRAPATAAKTIQVYVSKLRRALGDGVVVTRAGGYMLDCDRADVDAGRFERLVAEGRGSLKSGDPRQAAQYLREATRVMARPAAFGLRL